MCTVYNCRETSFSSPLHQRAKWQLPACTTLFLRFPFLYIRTEDTRKFHLSNFFAMSPGQYLRYRVKSSMATNRPDGLPLIFSRSANPLVRAHWEILGLASRTVDFTRCLSFKICFRIVNGKLTAYRVLSCAFIVHRPYLINCTLGGLCKVGSNSFWKKFQVSDSGKYPAGHYLKGVKCPPSWLAT